MSRLVMVELEMPADLDSFKLPEGVNERLQDPLDRQDQGERLTVAERMEAEGLVNLFGVTLVVTFACRKSAA